MELFEAKDHYILQNGDHSLWCHRSEGSIIAKRGEELCNAWNPVCLGRVYGFIGKVKVHPDFEPRVLLIRQREEVGTLPDCGKVYRITKVVLLPLSKESTKNLEIEMCEKHHFGIKKPSDVTRIPEGQQKPLQKTWNSLRNAAESVKPKKKDSKEKERFERKISEEIYKMFQDGTFYYIPNGDLTNCTQRQHEIKEGLAKPLIQASGSKQNGGQMGGQNKNTEPLWKYAHDAFFWNRYMLDDLITSGCPLADAWITPVIQGYVQIERCTLTFADQYSNQYDIGREGDGYSPPAITYTLCLVSRRSRYRAGTRYKRRGVDEDGNCANFVETEQILGFSNHVVSFVQTRGSVPLYWSQTGMKYKPPPRIEKGDSENHEAFSKHMGKQLEAYKKVALVSLLDLGGKEKVVSDAFLKHTIDYNSPDVTYIAFDFHEYCRGMKFENVSVLTESIIDEIKHMRYCWADENGVICDQRGVFRVNCLDCLDRTNVVQSAIARLVLEIQSRKLGLLPPDEELPQTSRVVYQQMWANNGDAISRQYAGTAALKGDFTRTGERRISGMMKDGVNSANRYYINKVKDAYKQTAIDLLLGNSITEDLTALRGVKAETQDDTETSLVEKEQNLKVLIDECKKMLLTEPEDCMGSWGLIDCDPVTGDPTQQDMDIILLVSTRAYYVARYDDEADVVTSYQKIYLEDLERFEIGPAPAVFKSRHLCVRIHYQRDEESGYFHTFRTTNTRLFNNIVIHINNEEEEKESLRAIYEAFAAARQLMSQKLPFTYNKLERKRSKQHADIVDIASQAQEKADVLPKRAKIAQVNSQSDMSNLLASTESNGDLPSHQMNVSAKSSSNALSPDLNPNASSHTRQTSTGRSFGYVARQTKTGLSNLTKQFMKFKPPVRVPGSKANPPGFLPAVLYSKDDEANAGRKEADKEETDQNIAESARILKGEKIVEKPYPSEALLIDFGKEDNSKQVNNSSELVSNVDLLMDLEKPIKVAEPEPAPTKTSQQPGEGILIDLGESDTSEKLQLNEDAIEKQLIKTQKSLDPSQLNSTKPAKLSVKTAQIADNHIKSCGAIAVHPHQKRFNPYPKFCVPTIRNLLEKAPTLQQTANFYLGHNQKRSGSPNQIRSPGIEIGIEASALDEWVNVDVFSDELTDGHRRIDNAKHFLDQPRRMRNSVSDSALDDGRSKMEALLVNAEDLERMDVSNPAAAFSRMRMRLSALPATGSDSPAARRKAVLELATSNKNTALKMFKHCKTKIILL